MSDVSLHDFTSLGLNRQARSQEVPPLLETADRATRECDCEFLLLAAEELDWRTWEAFWDITWGGWGKLGQFLLAEAVALGR